MIKKLRLRFILLSMISLLLVLGIIMLGINLINYRNINREADLTLEFLSENNGSFPREMMHMDDKGPMTGDMHMKPQSFDKKGFDRLSSPELPFQSRFFSVTLDENGSIVSTDVSNVAAVDETSAAEYAQTVAAKGHVSGTYRGYRYLKAGSDTQPMYIFLDITRDRQTARDFSSTASLSR